MYIDIKITHWERWKITPEVMTVEEIVEQLNKDPWLLFGYTERIDTELLEDSGEYVDPADNHGQPTLELYTEIKRDNTHEPIWDNVNGWIK